MNLVEVLQTAAFEGYRDGRDLRDEKPDLSLHALKMFITQHVEMPWISKNYRRPGFQHAWEVYKAALIVGYRR